jgi:hypothetical protein
MPDRTIKTRDGVGILFSRRNTVIVTLPSPDQPRKKNPDPLDCTADYRSVSGTAKFWTDDGRQ